MQPLIRKVGSADVVEQAAIAGALNPDIIPDRDRAKAAAEYIAQRLDVISSVENRGWSGTAEEDGGLSFSRRLRGVTRRHAIDGPLIRSAESHRLDAMAADRKRFMPITASWPPRTRRSSSPARSRWSRRSWSRAARA